MSYCVGITHPASEDVFFPFGEHVLNGGIIIDYAEIFSCNPEKVLSGDEPISYDPEDHL
jgi:hypothetical protein